MLKEEIRRSRTHAVQVNQLIAQLVRDQRSSQEASNDRLTKLHQRIAKAMTNASVTTFESASPDDGPAFASATPDDAQVG